MLTWDLEVLGVLVAQALVVPEAQAQADPVGLVWGQEARWARV